MSDVRPVPAEARANALALLRLIDDPCVLYREIDRVMEQSTQEIYDTVLVLADIGAAMTIAFLNEFWKDDLLEGESVELQDAIDNLAMFVNKVGVV